MIAGNSVFAIPWFYLAERIDQLRPSQIEQVIAACKELNPHFFGMTERLSRALQSKG